MAHNREEDQAEAPHLATPAGPVLRWDFAEGPSGRILRLFLDNALVWSQAYAIDPPLSNDARGLLRALGVDAE